MLPMLLQGSSWLRSPCSATSPGSSRPDSGESSCRTSRTGSGKSRIPRPISLPKRLEEKLSIRAARSPHRAASAGPAPPAIRPAAVGRLAARSPVKPAVPPRPKSRVRDTVKLFDAKSNKTFRGGSVGAGAGAGAGAGRVRKPVKAASPKTGGGEGMVDFDSGGNPFR